ncbi:catalase family protein [Mycobacterium ulcerans str. Harvey]|uniref:Catalase family protein n=1 Tax=Mycobacterium ulcerans str. Harvey TaxID=1299332 RepID=A0ABN0QUC6_MYCUL|nr:catalase family protein [Mycobacterium ulcerans str. Harvey]
MTDGIEASDDPVLRFRTLAYSASVKLRTGVDRGPQARLTRLNPTGPGAQSDGAGNARAASTDR